MENKPPATDNTVSIIVAVLNEVDVLPNLLDSIRKQTWTRIETIIIDGNSQDGTVDLIKSRENEINYWSSQPDSGVYQAWNRALKHATGDYVCFLGADDQWVNKNSLRDLMLLTTDQPDIVSSKSEIVSEGATGPIEIGKSWCWSSLRETMNLSHHGLLHKADLFNKHGNFDESFQIAGDYEFLLRCGNEIKAKFHDDVTVRAGASGISITRPFESLWERFRAQRMHHTISWFKSAMLFLKEYGGVNLGRVRSRISKIL